MTPRRLLIRADASERIGTGHVMRGLALAQAWRESGGEAIFALAHGEAAIEARLRGEGFEVIRVAAVPGSPADVEETLAIAAHWVAVDGYHFSADYFAAIHAERRLLVVDDWGHAVHYDADLVLNGNAYATPALYPSTPARLLLGTRYVPLRREFLDAIAPRPTPPLARTILVTLGGADPDNRTLLVVEALRRLTLPFEARVVIGASNPHGAAIRAAAAGDGRISVLEHVRDMPALMRWADVAVAGAGTTTWELCALGVPSLLAVLADNQAPVAEAVAARGAAIALGRLDDQLPDRIAARLDLLMRSEVLRLLLSESGRALVDGRGAARVVRAMHAADLRLRPANSEDCDLVYQINAHPAVRRWSFTSGAIALEEHRRWFAAKLADPACLLFVAEENGEPVGVLRYDLAGDEATVSIAIDPQRQGRGYGTAVLQAGSALLGGRAVRVRALIKPDNVASIRVFTSAGYRPAGETMVNGERVLVMAQNLSQADAVCGAAS
ncbi:MAG: UDP-2,4-diacetamido-2,4,6-trideoxy-beta-L-altropyranose hydrolase [Chloroflexota bacterium]|nr:UDP-2,4-diacetamido-2,4,6-trideoxy-beta-L-altropyranose hydrolase [Dehalococcoidia bacterium]MDW8254590.1 UDP-2,4-diacetamido-2,4,6-trideoxy-beta-L-altropyranose hydrolase [Chloroflexota bacterium]